MPGLLGSPARMAFAAPPAPSTHLMSLGGVIVMAAGFRSAALTMPGFFTDTATMHAAVSESSSKERTSQVLDILSPGRGSAINTARHFLNLKSIIQDGPGNCQ